jgi:hypothetical protein
VLITIGFWAAGAVVDSSLGTKEFKSETSAQIGADMWLSREGPQR